MGRSIKSIVQAIKSTVEETPPELAAELINRPIALAGGGALISGLDVALARETKLLIQAVQDPLTAVVRGCGMVLENLPEFSSLLVGSDEMKN